MNKTPLVTVIIPTYNSARTIGKVLKSLKKQSYSSIEILVIDAYSSDKTLEIAKKYNVKILLNDKLHQVYAKHMGFLEAKGKYVVHLDSDEVLVNKNSIKNKVILLEGTINTVACVTSGHKTPE